MRHSRRSQIVQSDGTFVLSALFMSILWMLGHWTDSRYWYGLAVMLITTYILLETNNRCQLLRVRSRMVSSTFLWLIGMTPMVHDFQTMHLAALSLAFTNLMLFSAYPCRKPAGWVCYAFIGYGAAVCLFLPFVILLPVVLFCAAHYLRVIDARSLVGGFVGLVVAAIYGILVALTTSWSPEWENIYASLPRFTAEGVQQMLQFSPLQAVNLAVVGVLMLWSIVYMKSNAFRDNMRTRMSFVTLRGELYLIALLYIAFPNYREAILPTLLAVGAPIVAHYWALSEGRWHNFWCWMWFVMLVALGIVNYFTLL